MNEPGTAAQAALIRLGSATVAESGGRPMEPGLLPVWPGVVMAAPLVPVWCASGDNLAIHRAVASSPPGVALVVAVAGEHERGWWGEVLTAGAQARGIVGLVIDACVRDTAAIASRRFPVWARGVALPGAEKVDPGRVGTRVDIRGCSAVPGDWVVADADGVVVITGADVADVVHAGQARAAREADMFDELASGRTTIELLGLHDGP
jgi:4-hydroxy-4-methyl-2-oxoglutarate aldolase